MTQSGPPVEAVPPTAEEIAALSVANEATIAELARMGAAVNQDSINNVRIQLLTEALLGDTASAARLAYEYRFQTLMAQSLADLGAQVRQQRLLQGVNVRNPKFGGGR